MPEPAAVTGSRWWLWLLLSLTVLLLDQASKAFILRWLGGGGGLVLTGWFNIVLAFNQGAAFSLLAHSPALSRLLFSAIAVLASIALLLLMRLQSHNPPVLAGAALILGGAVGNLSDRLRLGSVVDFIQWHVGELYWPAFNVADSAITAGALLLLLQGLRSPRTPP